MTRTWKTLLFATTLAFATLTIVGSAETPKVETSKKVERVGSVIGIRKEKIDEYKRLHADAWPGVLRMINQSNIRNYAIYLTEVENDKFYLFSHFEYVGDDFEKDMKKMADDPTTQRWWKYTDPCQIPVPKRKSGEHWKRMEEVFYTP